MSDHAVLQPSSAGVWVNCHGSVRMCQQFPQRADSPQSMEGTAAHSVMAELMHGHDAPVGSLAPNGIAITAEMHESAELFVEVFPPESFGPGGSLRCEQRVECPSIHSECWGTVDAAELRNRMLKVVDLKYGHVFVDEFENYQLIAYASGELDALQFDWSGTSGDLDLELIIVQPRCYAGDGPIRVWKTTALSLIPYIERLRAAALEALGPNPTLNCGEWCNHCSALHACPAAQHTASLAIGVAYNAMPSPMTPESLGLMLRRVTVARAMLNAVEGGLVEEAQALIQSGTPVQGFSLERGRGKVEWIKPADEILALGEMFGVDLRKVGLKTPIQASKLLAEKGIDGGVTSEYSAHQAGGLRLVLTDMSKLRQVFS